MTTETPQILTPEILLSKGVGLTDFENWLIHKLSSQLNISTDEISITKELATYGLDSMHAVMISGELEEALDIELPSTILWDYPTIQSLSAYLFNMTNN